MSAGPAGSRRLRASRGELRRLAEPIELPRGPPRRGRLASRSRSSGRATRSTATSRTTSPAARHGLRRPPRDVAAEHRRARRLAALLSIASTSPVPASSTCSSPVPGTARRSRSCSAPGIGTARARPTGRAHPGRDGVGEPDRPDHGRGGAERRLRRLGRALLEFAGHTGRAGVLLQRRRLPDGALPRVRRGARRGEEPPEDGYRGAYIQELAKLTGDPVPHMLDADRATLERFRIHFDSWARQSELERELPEILPSVSPTYESGGRDLRALLGARRRQGPGARPLRRSGGGCPPTRPRTSPTSRQAGARLRPRDLRPRRRPPRASAAGTRWSRACSATTRRAWRCSSTSSSI